MCSPISGDNNASGALKSQDDLSISSSSSSNSISSSSNEQRIGVWPTKSDVTRGAPDLTRSNLVEEGYVSGEQYIEIQSRLVKEELVRPLREDIAKIREETRKTLGGNSTLNDGLVELDWKCEELNHILVYTRVEVKVDLSLIKPFNGLLFEINFDKSVPPLDKIVWLNSSRLKPGNLICLSCDNFDKSIIFAVIAKLNVASLIDKHNQYGQLFIQVADESVIDLLKDRNKRFIAIEGKTFFEGVRYTLQELQSNEVTLVVHNETSPIAKQILTGEETVESEDEIHISEATMKKNEAILDSAQFDAFQEAFRNRFAIIQGPPGTGKTFVGLRIVEALLENTRDWSDGCPILVLCYKNHSLDQFLKGVLGLPCKNVLRVGGKCMREDLQTYRLEKMRGKHRLTHEEFRAFNDVQHRLQRALLTIEESTTNKKHKLDGLKNRERLEKILEELRIAVKHMKDEGWSRDYAIITEKEEPIQVIGMTVTCATKRKRLLELLEPKIVIVEEASEIGEAHLIAALPSTVERLVLIGDHKQLKPHTRLREYNMDISLFERMIINEVEYIPLNLQYRMRQVIANIIRKGDFYVQKIDDAPNVFQYERYAFTDDKHLFFLNHSMEEDKTSFEEVTSKSNHYEATWAVEMAKYLVLERVRPQNITILVTYKAQKELILNIMRKREYHHTLHKMIDKKVACDLGEEYEIEGDYQYFKVLGFTVRVTTVDGYQGEENDIIILSMVRSKVHGDIGFLRQANRVCVALSRARKAMFCIGNFEPMVNGSREWRKIIDYAKKIGAFVNRIPLKSHHLNASNDDFDFHAAANASDMKFINYGPYITPDQCNCNAIEMQRQVFSTADTSRATSPTLSTLSTLSTIDSSVLASPSNLPSLFENCTINNPYSLSNTLY